MSEQLRFIQDSLVLLIPIEPFPGGVPDVIRRNYDRPRDVLPLLQLGVGVAGGAELLASGSIFPCGNVLEAKEE
ncbi:uncharacterized protein J3R85_009203 [Psidium guajava]|nr:uncharacterized protein J3R85_009203 [Psidium guajava]